MKRVQRKKPTEKTLQCVTRSKKKKQEETELFTMITHDLKLEFLFKTPAKSIAKLNFVSKLLSSIVRSKSFTDAYMAQSSSHPRLLLRARCDGLHFFHSSPQENLSYDVNERVSIMELDYRFSPPVRGFICGRVGYDVLVGNPSTGQFITLPRVTRRVGIVLCFLGYEPVNDVYKVLRLTLHQKERRRLVADDKFEVFTLGGSDKHWRMVECKHRHLPPFYQTTWLCINGVVYYLWSWTNKEVLMSFDLRNEEFVVVKLPQDVRRLNDFGNFVNFSGKIAVVLDNRNFSSKLDLWILEDASKQEWSNVSFVVPSWGDLVGGYYFWFRGALSTGELIFATHSTINPFYYISYDIKENNAKRVVVEGIGDSLAKIDIFLDHVENPMVLSM